MNKIEQFLFECEQSQIRPTALILGKSYFKILKNNFPSLFTDSLFCTIRYGSIPIIVTEHNYVGVGLIFGEHNIDEFDQTSPLC